MDNDRYKEIASSQSYIIGDITTFVPTITDRQYQRGYIERCFIQKANDSSSNIFEVSVSEINRYKGNPFYIQTKLDWRITGDPIEVKKSNSISLQLASEDIPKIALYLPNLLQFHKK